MQSKCRQVCDKQGLPSCSPYAVATLLVATDSNGTLKSFVIVLYTEIAKAGEEHALHALANQRH